MAYNDQGSQEYRVKISTNPEPKGNLINNLQISFYLTEFCYTLQE